MTASLIQVDRALTLTINHFHTSGLDGWMILFSEKTTWIPLYLLLLFLVQRRFGWKNGLIIVVAFVLNLVLTDQVSVFMKESFERLRPCHSPALMDQLHLPDGCGGLFGFVSSHAANTMGLALLAGLVFRTRWLSILLFLWALVNGYSRIYLGKHYVADVIGGFALALVLAVIVYQLLRFLSTRFHPEFRAQL